MRWTDRLIGLVSTMILARLLVPDDFGIIAMASMVIGLVDVLLDMGVDVSLIQNQSASQDDFNSAWTLRLIQAMVAATVVVIAAYPAAHYFHDARVTPVIQVLAIALLASGLENIGVVTFQKKMEFGLEFRFLFLKRISGFLVTITAAALLRSYWALIIGSISGRAIGVGLSYLLHPMRPRLSLVAVKPILSFSGWNLLRGIGGYTNENLHRFVVGHRTSSSVLGAYSLGSEIAALPSTEVISPLSRVLFPVFVKFRDDLGKLKQTFLLALGVQALIGIPSGIGLALVAEELVLTLLGEKWRMAIVFVQIMGVINVLAAIGHSGGYLLLAVGRARVTAVNVWLQIALFGAMVGFLFPGGGAVEIAWLRLLVASCGLVGYIYVIRGQLGGLTLADLLGMVWRPTVASATMGLVLLQMTLSEGVPVAAWLGGKVIIGGIVYTLVELALWRVTGCPSGAESYILGNAGLESTLGRWVRGSRPP
jgi:lipopolysaccharide exporter